MGVISQSDLGSEVDIWYNLSSPRGSAFQDRSALGVVGAVSPRPGPGVLKVDWRLELGDSSVVVLSVVAGKGSLKIGESNI